MAKSSTMVPPHVLLINLGGGSHDKLLGARELISQPRERSFAALGRGFIHLKPLCLVLLQGDALYKVLDYNFLLSLDDNLMLKPAT